MQQVLRDNLLSCATAFAKQRKVALSTLGKMSAGDAPFFQRLTDPSKTFTAQKYDDVMLWFSANWPDDIEWPDGVFRPAVAPPIPVS